MTYEWTRMICAGALALTPLLSNAVYAAGTHAAVMGQRHFDAYCTYLSAQHGESASAHCSPTEPVQAAKEKAEEVTCPNPNPTTPRRATRTRYTVRYVRS